jgi:excisionase family DNA binding protein
MTDDRWLSVDEIAVYLGISKETVYRWLDRGSIPAHRVGKLWKFKPSEIDGWVKSGAAGTKRQIENNAHEE